MKQKSSPDLPASSAYVPLTNKQKFEREFLFCLPGHKGVFQLHRDRYGREYVSRCVRGVWQYDYALGLTTDNQICLEKGGDVTAFLYLDLQFDLS